MFLGTKGSITKPPPGTAIDPFHPLSRGLVGYWLFNESAGSRVSDISGYGNHGAISGNPVWGGSKFGGGLQFVEDYVDCGYNGIGGLTRATVAIWVFFNAETEQHIVDISDLQNFYVNDWWNVGDPYLSMYVGDLRGKWHHMVYTFAPSSRKAYLDGVEVGSDSTTQSFAAAPVVRIGDYFGGTGYGINGTVDLVYIYNRVLSATEANQLCHDPLCNLLRVPTRYVAAAGPAGAIMNQFQNVNIGADLYNGGIIA